MLVDDGSTDASTEVARRYADQNPGKVRYLEHEGHQNRGASATRNLGIRNARGSYIAFLDADDSWLPQKLEQQVNILELWPEAGMVCGASLYWYSWTGCRDDVDYDVVRQVGAPQNTLVQPPEMLLHLYPLGEGAAPSLNTVLVRADVVKQIGGWEEQFRVIYTDQAFLAKIYLKALVYVASEVWDYYRQHSDSACYTTRINGNYHVARLAFLRWLEDYLDREGYKGTELWDAMQAALLRYRHPVLLLLIECRRCPAKRLRRLSVDVLRTVLPTTAFLWLRSRLSRDPYASSALRRRRPPVRHRARDR